MKILGDRYSKYQEVSNIANIITTCVGEKRAVTFSLEGPWGRGKTWILEKIEAKLKNLDITKSYTQTQLSKASSNYLIIRYNACEKDYCDEPIIAITLTIINQINEMLWKYNVFTSEMKKVIKSATLLLEGLVGSISKKIVGFDVVSVGKKAYKRISSLREANEIKASITTDVDNIETDIALVVKTLDDISKIMPIVFIVDELDRCVPSVAIKTLERLHHIFGKIECSVTVISIYREQLEQSVKMMFGEKITPNEYLRKFINFKVVLSAGDVDEDEMNQKLDALSELFCKEDISKASSPILKEICSSVSARDFENLCDNALLCHKMMGIDTKDFPGICMEAELLLQAYRLGVEREGLEGNVSPKYGNDPKTPLGKSIKPYLKGIYENQRSKDNNMYNSPFSNVFETKDSKTIILLVLDTILDYNIKWVVFDENKTQFNRLKEYYSNYKIYFKLLR